MFISNDAFEVPYPVQLLPRGGHYFRAIELALRSVWYVVTFKVMDEHDPVLHTYCFGWDRQIFNWLHTNPSFAISSLQQVRPVSRCSGWEMNDVARVWERTVFNKPKAPVRQLIFERPDGHLFEGIMGHALAERPAGLRLVLELQ